MRGPAALRAARKPELEGCAELIYCDDKRLSTSDPGPVNNSVVYGWDSLYQAEALKACVIFPDFLRHG